jgi:hypothetical protein
MRMRLRGEALRDQRKRHDSEDTDQPKCHEEPQSRAGQASADGATM